MFESIILWAVIIIVVVVAYHYFDSGNIHKALHASKDTGRYAGYGAKELGATMRDAWMASKAEYQAQEAELKRDYAKAGKDWKEGQRQRDRENITKIKGAFADVRKQLHENEAAAKLRAEEAQKAYDELLASVS